MRVLYVDVEQLQAKHALCCGKSWTEQKTRG